MIITDINLLRVKCEDVLPNEVDELRQALETELKCSERAGRPGIGLAAPQIGIAKNMAIVRINDKITIDLVNCKIVRGYDKTFFDKEGCLSFPARYEKTLRFQEIHVEGNLVYPHAFIAQGLAAVCIQHELDHLNGILLPDLAIK